MRRYAEFLLDHKFLFICILALISLFFISNLPKIKINDNIDALVFKVDPDYLSLQTFYNDFGYDEIVLVAFHDDDILTKSNLGLIDRLDKKIKALDEVEEVISLISAVDIESKGDSLTIVKLIESYPQNREGWEVLRKKIKSNPLYYKTLISEDFKTTAIHLKMKEEITNRKIRERFVSQLENIIEIEKSNTGKDIVDVGVTILGAYTTRYTQRDILFYMPFTIVLVLGSMFVFFRNYFLAIIPFLTILLGVLWTMGFLVLISGEVNILTALVPTLIFVIGTSDCIHILSNYQDNIYRETTRKYSIIKTIETMAIPCFLTSITTMFGFSSLYATKVIPLQQLGIYSAFGIGCSYVLGVILIPILLDKLEYYHLNGFRKSDNPIPGRFKTILKRLADVDVNNRTFVIVSVAIVIVLTTIGFNKLHIDTEGTNYFGKESKIQKDHNFVNKHLAGSTVFHVVVEGEENYIKEKTVLFELEKLAKYIKMQENVSKVMSIVDIIKYSNYKINREDDNYYRIPNETKQIAELLLLISLLDDQRMLEEFVNRDYSKAVLTIRYDKHDVSTIDNLVEKIRDYINNNMQTSNSIQLVGTHLLFSNLHRPILDGLKRSFFLASIIIFIIIWISFRSFWVSLISMIPNLLPIFFTFGVMGLLNIPLNFLTSPFACIGMGLAVDDTIHFLARFKKELEKDGDYVQSVYRTMESVGKAIIYTSIVFVAGFSIFMFSNFQVTKNFGALVSLTVIGALIADLFLLPVLLLIFKPFKIKENA